MKVSQTSSKDKSLHRTFTLWDLSSLSISSVGPAFSISAAAGVMIGYSGVYSLMAMLLIAIPFVLSAFIFRMLNRSFPQSGASYHWSGRVLGRGASRFQGWVLILAYFTSLPPIVLPAAQYTIALIHPGWQTNVLAEFSISSFWLVFASFPLLSGARPTARVTQIFLAIEIVFLVLFAALGAAALPHSHFPAFGGRFPVAGVLLTMVVATTILDGWEIDSYASEEAEKPTRDPGVGGIIGALIALLIYAILLPLMLAETPLAELANSPDPMVAWAQHLTPRMSPLLARVMLIPILASTAGSLWLTGYILIRALFAMGRDRLLPVYFATLNRRGSPGFATLVVFGVLWAITALQLFVSSLSTFFAIILSAAGFFLTLEFMLDNLTATVFVWRSRSVSGKVSFQLLFMGAVSAFTFVYLALVLVAFLLLSPRVISSWTDITILCLLVFGVGFTFFPSRVRQGIYIVPVSKELTVTESERDALQM